MNPPFYSKLLNKPSTHPSPAARIYSPFGALLTQQSIFAPMMLWMEVGSLKRRPILLIPADLLWPARDRGPDTTPPTLPCLCLCLPRPQNFTPEAGIGGTRSTCSLSVYPQICLNTFFRGGQAFESKQKTCANYFSSRP